MIESISESQWREIYELREKFRRAGTCTEPADRAATERGISLMYERLGKPRPAFIWTDGPASALLAYNLLPKLGEQLGIQLWGQLRAQLWGLRGQLTDQLWDQLREQLWGLRGQLTDQLTDQLRGQLTDQLWEQLWDQLRAQLREQLREQLWDQLRNQLGNQLGDQLGIQLREQLENQLGIQIRDQLEEQLWDQLGEQLWDQLGDQLGNQLENQFWGQLGDQLWGQLWDQLRAQLKWPRSMRGGEELYWIAWLLGGEVAGVDYVADKRAQLDDAVRLFSACGWWIPLEGVVLCAERHRAIRFDAERRLHCETGPAIECRDGYSVYAWHGTRIPAKWIESPDTLDPATALTWKNIEQRRCAAEILGWDRVISTLDTRTIDEDADPQVGTLLEVELPDIGRERFLRVQCGTKRTFCLPVPPDMQTALQANAWTYGIEDTKLITEREART